MTTSYETDTAATGSTTPTYNAEGHQVWNPSVGIYHEPAKDQRESYGGIVGALQDLQVEASGKAKSYPNNFAGIIAAIQDLQIISEGAPPVFPGPGPDGGQIIIDINGNPSWEIITPPRDGELWFDTRQGRLFIAIDEEWYQTNGADGIPIVTDNPTPPDVDHPIPGQFWWDSANNDLYIHDGLFRLPDGEFTEDGTLAGTDPVWKLITDGLADSFQTTRTLPLGSVGPKIQASNEPTIITKPDPTQFSVQSDYNVWLYGALLELDEYITNKGEVIVGVDPPAIPVPGQLWYDTESLELSIWYEDDDRGQWVPTSTSYMFDDEIATVNARIDDEQRTREQAIHALQLLVDSINGQDDAALQNVSDRITSLAATVASLPTYDLTPYATVSTVTAQIDDLQADINSIAADLAALPAYANQGELDMVTAQLATKASKAEVEAVEDAIPDVSGFVTAADITNAISNITTDFLPRTGGVLTGSFTLNKTDISLPGLDFSSSPISSRDAFKFQTMSPTGSYQAQFGTTTNFWEYAWQFDSNEDFCWIYNDSNKVFSITKDGPACSSLVLGDFTANNDNGRVLTNKIDVRERLNTYQAAFEQMRQGVSNATDFDSLKANILSALASV